MRLEWKYFIRVQAKVGERAASSTPHQPSKFFICDEPHRVWDCTRKEKLNVIMTEEGDSSGSEVFLRSVYVYI